jgi:hypothetical protein
MPMTNHISLTRVGEQTVGPCAKQRVLCTLVHPDGRRWTGENLSANWQPTCPRGDMPSGTGYELCANVCQQMGHAEEQAVRAAGVHAAGTHAYLEGHTYACDNCKSVLARAGVEGLTIGPPPAAAVSPAHGGDGGKRPRVTIDDGIAMIQTRNRTCLLPIEATVDAALGGEINRPSRNELIAVAAGFEALTRERDALRAELDAIRSK